MVEIPTSRAMPMIDSPRGGHKCLVPEFTCAFCGNPPMYPNFLQWNERNAHDFKRLSNNDVPIITDERVLKFFHEIERTNWTHALCCGMGVTTHAQLLMVDANDLFQRNEKRILGMLQGQDEMWFIAKLTAYQIEHRRRMLSMIPKKM